MLMIAERFCSELTPCGARHALRKTSIRMDITGSRVFFIFISLDVGSESFYLHGKDISISGLCIGESLTLTLIYVNTSSIHRCSRERQHIFSYGGFLIPGYPAMIGSASSSRFNSQGPVMVV